MNLLSLFNGISGGILACERAGLKIDNHYISEIDKYANIVTMKNYPDSIQLGDIAKCQDWDIDFSTIDIVIAGFPCQSWSIAGKQMGDRDERGMLFWFMLDVIKMVKSCNHNVKFIIENVKMKIEFEQYITFHTEQALGRVNKYLINSALLSAQQRKRYYWTNIEGLEQPEDKGILLKDILEDNIIGSCNLSEKYGIKGFRHLYDKSKTLTASSYKGYGSDGCTIIAKPLHDALTTRYSGYSFPHDFIKHKKSGVFQPIRLGQIGKGGQGQRIYSVEGKTINLSASGGGQATSTGLYKVDLPDGEYIIRKLTPIECERLQTYPDNWTEGISNTQRYKCLGNSFTVDVIAYILKHIDNTCKADIQLSLFD